MEEINGLGRAAIYHEDGALHDLQFVKIGLWLTTAGSGIVGSETIAVRRCK